MIYEVNNIDLDYSRIDAEKIDYQPYMRVYVPNTEGDVVKYTSGTRPTIVILPGGGYGFRSEREAEPIAMKFLAHGYNACVVYYSVKPATFPSALLEALYAVKYMRENAERFYADPSKIYVCGFSAGGHLAASTGVFWNSDVAKKYFGDVEAVKPNGLILSYPVITCDPKYAHNGSFSSLLGAKDSDEAREWQSLEKRVTENTPPAFIWTTNEDTLVPCENSILFALALRRNYVSVELHMYEKASHGAATGDNVTCVNTMRVRNWIDMACEWCDQERLIMKRPEEK